MVVMVRNIVLVNEQDEKLGLAEIWDAHKNPGKLHRAISVLLWRRRESRHRDACRGFSLRYEMEVLLQMRSNKKPLWPMFWSNTCCTHPYDEENYKDCAVRRLKEEMGIKIDKGKLKELYRFKYHADYDEGLSEYEVDMVVVGEYEGEYELNLDEVSDAKWVSWKWLEKDVQKNVEEYVPWFVLMVGNSEIERVMK